MTFALQKTNANFSTSQLHKFINFEAGPLQSLAAIVNSYASVEAYNASLGTIFTPHPLINWQDRYPIPTSAAGDPESWLMSEAGPFPGATLVSETSDLERIRDVKWAQVKAQRSTKEANDFVYLGHNLQTDAASVSRLQNQAVAAQKALSDETPYVLNWTTKDNTVLELDAQQVAEFPVSFASFQDALHQISIALRNQLYDPATDSIEKIQAITWPI